jgi:glycosyl transferase family 2
MPLPDPVSRRPEVSVIVPARNEEAGLGACLESLMSQDDANFEVLVVDDGSTDRTRQIALSFPGVQVIDAGWLPAGWTGKNNALTAGARHASGEWLLFTDADTVHRPGSLARALAEAKKHRAALLSYSPEQDVRGFWQHAVMPVIFAELACRYRPTQVCDPASPMAAANGQYLLVSQEAYEAVGGHAAIASSLLEDVALARAIKTSGRRIRFGYGADAVRTRMYRSYSQLEEGWTKNLALLFSDPEKIALRRAAEFGLIVGGGGLAAKAAAQRRPGIAAVAAGIAALAYAFHRKRVGKAHFSSRSNLLAVFGLPLFSYLLLRSKLSHRTGKVSWKGRSYESSGRDAASQKNAGSASPSESVNADESQKLGSGVGDPAVRLAMR